MNRGLALVAVRMKSIRCEGKALSDLGGRPLLARLCERIAAAKRLHGVIVCTSTHPQDGVLAESCAAHGLKVFRGDEDDVMGRFLDCLAQNPSDHIVRVTGDNPLTDPEILDVLIESPRQSL